MDMNAALRDLEVATAQMLAVQRGIVAERINVTLTREARDGKQGMRIDVLVDGEVDEVAEKVAAEIIVLCALVASVGATLSVTDPVERLSDDEVSSLMATENKWLTEGLTVAEMRAHEALVAKAARSLLHEVAQRRAEDTGSVERFLRYEDALQDICDGKQPSGDIARKALFGDRTKEAKEVAE